MGFRKYVLGALTIAAVGAGCTALASPAWAAEPGVEADPGCQLIASNTTPTGSTLKGLGTRRGCSDTVTYMWVRVYRVIDLFPDAEVAVKGAQYVQNGRLEAHGSCDGHSEYYTHVSTATGMSGNSVESGRVTLC